MYDFELQTWHVILFFSAIVLHIFKNDLADILHAFLFIGEHRFQPGQRLEIQSASGAWEAVTFVQYRLPLPFGKVPGGLVIRHQQEDREFLEKISFANYAGLRVRVPCSAA